jgi:formate dehydrogenase subunit delta
MHIDNLVHMANRIGEFFQSVPDRDEAARETAQHLRKFWEPRMRRMLLEHLDRTDGAGMLPIVKAAVLSHRASLEPATAV